MGFISDYLIRGGYTETVKTFYKETESRFQDGEFIPSECLSVLTNLVDELRGGSSSNALSKEGILVEWWKVFWRILKETEVMKKKKINYVNPDSESDTKNIINTKRNKLNTEDDLILSISRPSFYNTKTKITRKIKSKTKKEEYLERKSVLDATKAKILLSNEKLSSKQNQVDFRIESKDCSFNFNSSFNNNSNSNSNNNNNNNNNINSSANVLGVIDQISQPIDSRQLLLLRQSLFHEYLKKQNQSSANFSTSLIDSHNNNNNNNNNNNHNNHNNHNTNSVINNNNNNNNNHHNHSKVLLNHQEKIDIPGSNGNSFNNFDYDLKDELNFNDFMNEYFI